MALSLLVDEDVERVVALALDQAGYDITLSRDRLGAGAPDEEVLASARDHSEVILTEDRDFVALGAESTHQGIFLIASQGPDPGAIVRAVDRLTATLPRDEIAGKVFWIEDWT